MTKSEIRDYAFRLTELKRIAGSRLKDEGIDWILVESAALGENVLWILREDPMVPHKYKDLVQYAEKEVEYLVRESKNLTKDGMRQLHIIKKEFGGDIISGSLA